MRLSTPLSQLVVALQVLIWRIVPDCYGVSLVWCYLAGVSD